MENKRRSLYNKLIAVFFSANFIYFVLKVFYYFIDKINCFVLLLFGKHGKNNINYSTYSHVI